MLRTLDRASRASISGPGGASPEQQQLRRQPLDARLHRAGWDDDGSDDSDDAASRSRRGSDNVSDAAVIVTASVSSWEEDVVPDIVCRRGDALPAWLRDRVDFAALEGEYRRGSRFVTLALQTPPRLRNERELALVRRWLAPQRRFRGLTPEQCEIVSRAMRVSVLAEGIRLWADSTMIGIVVAGSAVLTTPHGDTAAVHAGHSFGCSGWWNLFRRGLVDRFKKLGRPLAEVRRSTVTKS
jgi:hypothetical protein